ncbi:MAG: 6,7-dimethyl-8-ribityllumazine synthase [uncultured bacterium]|nr:MAG: 6,7-dimethyl-8-ribityllumazine synthase [uncultured bacterium]
MTPTSDFKIAIVSSDFWQDIVTNLEIACVDTLSENGINKNQIDMFRVPGSLEIPLMAKKLAQKESYDAIIVFGAIHKGKTYHFELIANECTRACMDISLQFEIPIIYEVLAVYDIADAVERSTKGSPVNRGVEAAYAALKMISTLKQL